MSEAHAPSARPPTRPAPLGAHPQANPEGEAEGVEQADPRRQFALAIALFIATCATTTYVGGLGYSIPVMAILLSHECGHYIAARIHRVPASPPYFIPLPVAPLGTMGAVIAMPGRIRSRNALLDIGAAGPLAGLVVALPVLAYGISVSEVQPQGDPPYALEGHSLLYEFMLWAIKGPTPEGHDIFLSDTAFAGWTGLLVTMINLIPVAQLDGGHVAYALFGARQNVYSRRVRNVLPWVGLAVALYYGLPLVLADADTDPTLAGFGAGMPWLLWYALLRFMVSRTGVEHPPTDGEPLSPKRRAIAALTLGLFVVLFMPFWMRTVL